MNKPFSSARPTKLVLPTDQAAAIAVCIFIFGMIVLLVRTAWISAFDADEFQHLETAWLISTGAIPYKDFFEHHTPLYHLLISPLLSNRAILTNGDAAVRLVLALRVGGVALCACILLLTYFITQKIAGRTEALFASALLVTSVVFIQKGIEIRPDQFGALLLLASTLSLMLAKKSHQWTWYILLSGAAVALAILTTQKVLLALPGLAITFLAVFAQRRMSARDIIKGCAIFAGAAAIAALPLLFYFWSQDALGDFIKDNFLLGAHWKHITSTIPWILSLICREDGLFIFLVGIGLFDCLRQKKDVAVGRLATVAPMFSMLLFMPVFPVVQRQYIFLFLPYVAMLGGIGATFITRTRGAPEHKVMQPASILLLAIIAHGVSLVAHQWSQRNDVTLDTVRFVVEQTTPDATVLPAWSTGIAFRKPAFFYPVLHEEIRPLIPEVSFAKLRDGLRDGSIAPAVIAMDQDMEQMPKGIVDALKSGWEPTGVGALWKRKRNAGSL